MHSGIFKSCYISSCVTFIKMCANLQFFSIKFPIERSIRELFTTVLKFMHSAQWHFQIVLYLLTYSFYQKMFRFKVFQYKISNRMSYLRALYDNFEIFNGKKFHWDIILNACKKNLGSNLYFYCL